MAKFAEEYVRNGYNGAAAYRFAYGQDNKQVCASEAYKLLKDPRIVDEVERVEGDFRIVFKAAGIDKKTIAKVLAEMISAEKVTEKLGSQPDYTARKDAITLWGKLTGDFKEKKELEISKKESLEDVDLTKLTDEERGQIEKDLLAEL